MKKICLVSSMVLPVPAVKGGAVETLINSIAKENERKKEAYLTVVSKYDVNAETESRKYKYTNFIFIKQTHFDKLMRIAYKIVKRVFHYDSKLLCSTDRKVLKSLKDLDFDEIVFEGGDLYYFEKYLAYFDRSKLSLHVHSVYKPKEKVKNIYNRIICISDYIRDYWKIELGNPVSVKIVTVHNGIDQTLFLSYEDCYKDKDIFTVLYCGRIVEAKGIKELIEGFQMANIPSSKLLIIGNNIPGGEVRGSYIRKLEQLANGDSRIQFLGKRSYIDLPKYYANASVTVVPTKIEEGAGLVVVESLASGTPVIATKSGGMPEYFNEKCGILIDKGAELSKNISLALIELYSNKTLQMKLKEHARDCAIKFSTENYYDDFMSLFI